jgi:hypothetical protein
MSKRTRENSVDNVFAFIAGDDAYAKSTMEFFRNADLPKAVVDNLDALYATAYEDGDDAPYFPWGLYGNTSPPLLDTMLARGDINKDEHIKYSLPVLRDDGQANFKVSGKKRVCQVGAVG